MPERTPVADARPPNTSESYKANAGPRAQVTGRGIEREFPGVRTGVGGGSRRRAVGSPCRRRARRRRAPYAHAGSREPDGRSCITPCVTSCRVGRAIPGGRARVAAAGQAAWPRSTASASGASPGRRRGRTAACASQGPEGGSAAARCPAPGRRGLVRGAASDRRAARAAADRQTERVPGRGAQRVLGEELLVRQKRMGCAQSGQKTRYISKVSYASNSSSPGSTPSGSARRPAAAAWTRYDQGASDCAWDSPPRTGSVRRCGLDHSKHFPSGHGGNHEDITKPVRALWRSSHAAGGCRTRGAKPSDIPGCLPRQHHNRP